MAAIMFCLNWRFTLIALSVAPLLFVVTYSHTRQSERASREVRKKESEVVSRLQEVLSSIGVVKALAREDYEQRRLEEESVESVQIALRARSLKARLSPLGGPIVALGTALVLWFGARLVLAGSLSASSLIIFIWYPGKIYKPMQDFAKMTDSYSKAVVGYERICEIFDTQPQVADLPGNFRLLQCIVFTVAILLMLPASSAAKHTNKSHDTNAAVSANAPAVLWRNPGDIASRNLYYGPGGEKDAPHTTYTFLKEDLNTTSPKFDVRDENEVKWRVKMSVEARPEIVATRLVWAVGYWATEDYLLPEMHVENMPYLKRGQKLVDPDGTVHDVPLKRYSKDEKKIGDWQWRDNPFERQRELNGLRVMMALMNNGDLKDENNSVYEEKKGDWAA
jgi:ABC-type multidrug transport system fused ATPase/permease subunit